MSKITDIKNEEDYINTKKALKMYRPIAYLCFIAGGIAVGAFIVLGIIDAAIGSDICGGSIVAFLATGVLFVLGFVMLGLRSWIETKLEMWEKSHPTILQQPQYPRPSQAYVPQPVQQVPQQMPSQPMPQQQYPQITQPTSQTPQIQFCPFCGKKLQPDWKICGYCGRKIGE